MFKTILIFIISFFIISKLYSQTLEDELINIVVTPSGFEQKIKNTNSTLIKSIDFFDLYQGENIEPNKKSLAIKVVFEPKNETLKDQDIENFCNDIVFSLKSLGGSLRS